MKKASSLLKSSLFPHTKRTFYTGFSKQAFEKKIQTAEEAIEKHVKSSSRVFIHTGCSAPQALMRALPVVAKAKQLSNVNVHHLHVNGEATYMKKEYEEMIHVHPMFCGANERRALNEQRKNFNYIPVFLSETPTLFTSGTIPLDVAFIQVSPPDNHGFCSLGINIDCSLGAVRSAKAIIAQINPKLPRTHGDGFIHIDAIDSFVQHEEELPTLEAVEISPEERLIGKNVAELIPDRACLQLGIGSIPNAICDELVNHRDLGVHTEMFSDGIMRLYQKGVITNRFKQLHPDVLLTSFVMGSKALYSFVDDNPFVMFRCASVTNDVVRIQQNPNMMAINSALEVDITGQVCADSIGAKMYSGVGGQVDFILGSARSPKGKPIIALPSTYTDKSGKLISKIVPTLKAGAGVVTTRAHIHWVVTEYGAVDLYGKDLRERAKLLISIAHPELRDSLAADASKRYGY